MSATDDQIAGEAGRSGNRGDTGRRGREADSARAGSPRPPAKRLAVLACMDARLDPAKALGLQEGDAHVIRNAGGVATEDALRSLIISQRLLGTEEIILIHHTDCAMETFTDDAVKDQIMADTGLRPSFALESFPKAEEDVKQTAARIMASPFLPSKRMRGYLYEIETGELREVPLD
jgi:carbonic anhydrase